MSDPTNPYSIPQSNLEVETAEYGEIRLFSSQGRIGRLRYIASFSIVYLTALLSIVLMNSIASHKLEGSAVTIAAVATVMVLIGLVLCTFIQVFLSIQRLHDMNMNGLFILTFIIPLVNIALIFGLMFMSGNAERNRFGAPPPPNSLLVKIFGILSLFPVLFGMLSLIFHKH
jgi:uncharacterized membrane protein YhaH (DUF805 family)